MAPSATDLQVAVDSLVTDPRVPGAVLGVLQHGHVVVAAAGTANLRTGAPMTPDTLFLAGSITKTWVATAVMTLVDEGRVELDAPIASYLPQSTLGGAAARITVRQLLTHTSGLDAADLIVDVGRGDGAVERYLGLLDGVQLLHEPGELSSYCNPGFVLLGRLLEVLDGKPFRVALHDRLIEPLGLKRTVLTPEDALLHSSAIGHFPGPDGPVPTTTVLMPEGLAPAGSTLFTTAEDCLAFAAAHLAADGGLLSAGSAAQMAQHQIDLPAPELGSMGLSWFREQRGDLLVLSHGGGSLGGSASLQLVPGLGSAVVAFVNSTARPDALNLLLATALEALGVEPLPDRRRPAELGVDPQDVCGTYGRLGLDVQLAVEDGGLVMSTTSDLPLVRDYLKGQASRVPCRLLEGGGLAVGAGQQPGVPAAYFLDEGRLLYSGLRLARRR